MGHLSVTAHDYLLTHGEERGRETRDKVLQQCSGWAGAGRGLREWGMGTESLFFFFFFIFHEDCLPPRHRPHTVNLWQLSAPWSHLMDGEHQVYLGHSGNDPAVPEAAGFFSERGQMTTDTNILWILGMNTDLVWTTCCHNYQDLTLKEQQGEQIQSFFLPPIKYPEMNLYFSVHLWSIHASFSGPSCNFKRCHSGLGNILLLHQRVCCWYFGKKIYTGRHFLSNGCSDAVRH